MRLLEMFLLLELKDRLSHVAQIMRKKIVQRWDDKINDGGMTGLPSDWKEAMGNDVIPDPTTMSRNKEWADIYADKMSAWIVEWFSQFDPTKNKKYTQWILSQWLSETLWLEDAPKLSQTLETFEQHRKKLNKIDIGDRVPNQGPPDDDAVPPPERRADINSWKDYRTLARAMRPLVGTQAAGEKVTNLLDKPEIQDLMHHPVPDPVQAFGEEGDFDIDEIRSEGHTEGEEFDTMDWYNWDIGGTEDATTAIKPIYKSDRLAILQPNTREAACELGKGTEWCTAATTSENYFWNYAPQGPMYVILTDKMGKFQFHFETGQFANVHDEMLKDNEKMALVNAYPELRKIFAEQAEENSQMWLMDPATWTPDRLKQYLANKEGLIGNELMHRDGVLYDMPKAWDGQAPEETLQMIEAIMRQNPLDAWRYVRNPTEEDYLKGLQAEDTTNRGYNPATGILKDAIERGVELSDEALEAAIARDGESIMYLSPEKMREQPQWVLAAIQDQPRMLEYAASTAILNQPVWGELEDGDDKKRHETIIDILRNHPKGEDAVANATRLNPDLVHKFRDWFGTKPWMMAYQQAFANRSISQHMLAQLAQTIDKGGMKALDYNALLAFLMKNEYMHQDTFQAIESAMEWQGHHVPVEFQKALLDKNPGYMTFFKNFDPQIKQAAMDSVIAKQAARNGDPSAPLA